MSGDAWDAATFDGAERALRERVATWSPQERMAWLDAQVLQMHRDGLLLALRERKQRAVEAAWHRGRPQGQEPRR